MATKSSGKKPTTGAKSGQKPNPANASKGKTKVPPKPGTPSAKKPAKAHGRGKKPGTPGKAK